MHSWNGSYEGRVLQSIIYGDGEWITVHSWNGSYEGRVLQSSMGMENGSQCIHGMGHMKAEYYSIWEWRVDHSAGHMKAEYYIWEWRVDHSGQI